jgi:toxin ParE1/3/4
LAEIWAYIAGEASEDTATRFVAGFAKHLDRLLRFPESGVERSLLAPDLRVTFHHRYAIYYLPLASEILIVRVLHGARDAAALAEQGGFDA